MDYLLQKLLSFLFLIQTFSVTHKQTHWVLIKECTAMLAWMVFQIKTHLFFCLLPTSSYFTCIYQQHGRTQVNIHHFPQMGTSLNHLFPSYTNWCQVYAHKGGGTGLNKFPPPVQVQAVPFLTHAYCWHQQLCHVMGRVEGELFAFLFNSVSLEAQ